MKIDQEIYTKIKRLISLKQFNKAITYTKANREKIAELDYWFLLSVSFRYLVEYDKALSSLS